MPSRRRSVVGRRWSQVRCDRAPGRTTLDRLLSRREHVVVVVRRCNLARAGRHPDHRPRPPAASRSTIWSRGPSTSSHRGPTSEAASSLLRPRSRSDSPSTSSSPSPTTASGTGKVSRPLPRSSTPRSPAFISRTCYPPGLRPLLRVSQQPSPSRYRNCRRHRRTRWAWSWAPSSAASCTTSTARTTTTTPALRWWPWSAHPTLVRAAEMPLWMPV